MSTSTASPWFGGHRDERGESLGRDRARQSRRIAAAFVWSRVSITPPADVVIADPAPANPSRHELGAAPTMVDIRDLVPVRDDITSTGRHAALAPEVLAQLEAAGAR